MEKVNGPRLKQLRAESGLRQVEISVATGIERSYLSKMESTGKPSSWEKMCALADVFNVSLDEFREASPRPTSGDSFSEAEREIILLWRLIDEKDRLTIKSLLASLSEKNRPAIEL